MMSECRFRLTHLRVGFRVTKASSWRVTAHTAEHNTAQTRTALLCSSKQEEITEERNSWGREEAVTVTPGSRQLTRQSSAHELVWKCATGSEINCKMSPPGGQIQELHRDLITAMVCEDAAKTDKQTNKQVFKWTLFLHVLVKLLIFKCWINTILSGNKWHLLLLFTLPYFAWKHSSDPVNYIETFSISWNLICVSYSYQG